MSKVTEKIGNMLTEKTLLRADSVQILKRRLDKVKFDGLKKDAQIKIVYQWILNKTIDLKDFDHLINNKIL